VAPHIKSGLGGRKKNPCLCWELNSSHPAHSLVTKKENNFFFFTSLFRFPLIVTFLVFRLNSSVQITPYDMQMDSSNALDTIRKYDVVIDATDNVATRYLLSDACVLTNRPLVSGSALQLEGQLTVYNYSNGPCYRCLFPIPPPPETVTNCGDGGVLGAGNDGF